MDAMIHIGLKESHYDKVGETIKTILDSDNSDDVKKVALGTVQATCKVENVTIQSCTLDSSTDRSVTVHTDET